MGLAFVAEAVLWLLCLQLVVLDVVMLLMTLLLLTDDAVDVESINPPASHIHSC